MKLTLNGSPEELAKVLALISISELTNRIADELDGEMKKDLNLQGTINGNFTQTPNPILERAAEVPQPAAAVAENKTKVRRTRAEIEADKKADTTPAAPPVAQAPAADAATVNTGGVSMDAMKDFVLERSEAHGPAIRAKLNEYGVKKTGELDPKHWNAFWVFLQAL